MSIFLPCGCLPGCPEVRCARAKRLRIERDDAAERALAEPDDEQRRAIWLEHHAAVVALGKHLSRTEAEVPA